MFMIGCFFQILSWGGCKGGRGSVQVQVQEQVHVPYVVVCEFMRLCVQGHVQVQGQVQMQAQEQMFVSNVDAPFSDSLRCLGACCSISSIRLAGF